jgi:hypothetical protein
VLQNIFNLVHQPHFQLKTGCNKTMQTLLCLLH